MRYDVVERFHLLWPCYKIGKLTSAPGGNARRVLTSYYDTKCCLSAETVKARVRSLIPIEPNERNAHLRLRMHYNTAYDRALRYRVHRRIVLQCLGKTFRRYSCELLGKNWREPSAELGCAFCWRMSPMQITISPHKTKLESEGVDHLHASLSKSYLDPKDANEC